MECRDTNLELLLTNLSAVLLDTRDLARHTMDIPVGEVAGALFVAQSVERGEMRDGTDALVRAKRTFTIRVMSHSCNVASLTRGAVCRFDMGSKLKMSG